ncbi:MAG: hypothetical protein EA377_13685 [Phycisphaerales bacterium]|nr:MAG: hypothetical protein EA377_13685 [Phycisphaerales bacterium]
MLTGALVVIQILIALGMVRLLARRIIPAMGSLRQPELVLDVWLPLMFVLPVIILAPGIEGSLRGGGGLVDDMNELAPAWLGWSAGGAPVVIGMLLLAVGMIGGQRGIGPFGEEVAEGEAIGWRLGPRVISIALATGVLLLLLAAADVLSLWVGQMAFALAAVLLWVNTPDLDQRKHRDEKVTNEQAAAGFSMMLAVIGGAGIGLLGRFGGEWTGISAIVLAVSLAVVVAVLMARRWGGGLCMRTGLWVAGIGTLLGVGALSLGFLVPRSLTAIFGQEPDPQPLLITFGMGTLAFEAVLLIVISMVIGAWRQLPTTLLRLAGGGLLVVVIAFLILRLS